MPSYAHASRHSLLRGAATAALVAVSAPAWAGPSTWGAIPANGDWNRAGNWSPATVPNATADIATLDTTTTPAITLSANTTVNGIVFNAGAPVYTISAPEALTLTIGGLGLTNNSGVVQHFVSAAGQTVTNVTQGGYTYAQATSGGTIAFINAASAGSNVIFTNLGIINSANYYQGSTTFANTSSAATASFVNAGSAVANGAGGQTTFFDTATAASATFTNNGNTVSKGSYAYGNNGGTTYFLGGSTAANATITTNSGTVSGAEGGEAYFSDTATAGSATITNNGAIATGAQAGLTAFNDTSTAGAATIVNNGNTATGGVGGGTLRQGFTYGGATAFYDNSTAATAAITNNGSTVVGAYGGGVSVGDNATAANATITNNGSSVSGAFGGATVFIGSGTAGNATLIANGGTGGGGGGGIVFSETTSGGTATVKVYGNAALDISAHDKTMTTYVFTNNTFTTVTTPLPTPLVTIGSLEGTGFALLGSNSLGVGSNNASTVFSGTIANGGLFGGNGGSLTKVGTGTLTLSGGNAYTGGTTVSAGVLQIGSGGTSGSVLGNIVDNGALAFNRSDSFTFAGIISGTGSVAMQGPGMLTLSGVNSYGGATTVASGTIRVGAVGALPTSSDVTVASSATLDLNNLSQSVASLTGAGSVQLGSATLTIGSSNASTTYSGTVAGAGALAKVGTGTLTLTGTDSYSGGTTVGAGTIIASASGLGTGAITDNAALIVNQPVDAILAAPINGTGSLVKQGTGALNYTGTGTLSGATTVAAGLLAVNGSLANSAVTVVSGATLGGTGSVGGITAQSGSTVSPGNSIGTLTTSNLNLSGTLQVEASSTGTADQIIVNGPIALGSTSALNILDIGTFSSSNPYVYTIIRNAGGGAVTGTFGTINNQYSYLSPTISYTGGSGNDVILTLTPIGTQLVLRVTLPTVTITNIVSQSLATQVDGTLNGATVFTRTVSDTVTSTAGTAALADARSAVAGAPSLRRITVGAPTFIGNVTSVLSSTSNTVDVLSGTQVTQATINTTGPATVVTGNLGTCTTGVVGTAAPTGCALPGTSVTVATGATYTNNYTTTTNTVTPTTTTTVNQLVTAKYQVAAILGSQFGTVHALVGPAAFERGDRLIAQLVSTGSGGASSPFARVAVGRSGLTMFGGYFGSWSTTDADASVPVAGVSTKTDGFVLGIDKALGENLRAGVAVDYGMSNISVRDATYPETLSFDQTQVAMFAKWTRGGFALDGVAAYGFGAASTSLMTPTTPATAARNVRSWSVGGQASYAIDLDGTRIGLVAGVRYTSVDLKRFTETGGPTPLIGLAKTVQRTRVYGGVELARRFDLGKVMLTPLIHARAARDSGDASGVADLVFASAPTGATLQAFGPGVGKTVAELGGTLDLQVSDKVHLWAAYDGSFRSGARNHSARGGLTIEW